VSLVDTSTGEVVEIADDATARRLVYLIDNSVTTVNKEVGVLVDRIADALRLKVWIALGHGSWGELVDAQGWEFNPRSSADRKALAIVLRNSGMSYRGIGKLVGATDATIRRDVAGATNVAPEPEAEPTVKPTSEPVKPEPTPEPERVTGTDGKSYPASKPHVETDEERSEREWAQRALDTSNSFGSAVISLGAILDFEDRTLAIADFLSMWTPGAVSKPDTGDWLTPAGLRRIAVLLGTLADEMED